MSLAQLMGKSRDWEELQYTWTEWRRKSGRDMRDLYEQVAELTNEAARYNSKTNCLSLQQIINPQIRRF